MIDSMFKAKSGWGLMFLSTATLVFVTDQVTKQLVRNGMTLGESIPAEGRFRLSFSENSGAIFGLSLNSTFLAIMASVVVVAIVWGYFRFLTGQGRLLRLGLGLVLGGAAGNLLDRFRYGAVTDFIDVRLWGDYHWATFNVADAALSIGMCMLVFSVLVMSLEDA